MEKVIVPGEIVNFILAKQTVKPPPMISLSDNMRFLKGYVVGMNHANLCNHVLKTTTPEEMERKFMVVANNDKWTIIKEELDKPDDFGAMKSTPHDDKHTTDILQEALMEDNEQTLDDRMNLWNLPLHDVMKDSLVYDNDADYIDYDCCMNSYKPTCSSGYSNQDHHRTKEEFVNNLAGILKGLSFLGLFVSIVLLFCFCKRDSDWYQTVSWYLKSQIISMDYDPMEG